MLPEFKQLPDTGQVQGLVELLGSGPQDEGLTTFVPEDAFVDVSEREGREQLAIELSHEVWSLPPGERFAALAQIVYTVAALEEGKTLLLLDGAVPGEILDSSFEPVPQPVDRSTFAELEPWIVVSAPVPGATVGERFPVRMTLREAGGPALVTLRSDDEELARRRSSGDTSLRFDRARAEEELVVTIAMRDRSGTQHRVSFPVRSPSSP